MCAFDRNAPWTISFAGLITESGEGKGIRRNSRLLKPQAPLPLIPRTSRWQQSFPHLYRSRENGYNEKNKRNERIQKGNRTERQSSRRRYTKYKGLIEVEVWKRNIYIYSGAGVNLRVQSVSYRKHSFFFFFYTFSFKPRYLPPATPHPRKCTLKA